MWQLQTIFSEYFSHTYRYFRGTLSIPYREFFWLKREMLYDKDIFIKEEKYKYFCMYKYIVKEMCTKYWIILYNINLKIWFASLWIWLYDWSSGNGYGIYLFCYRQRWQNYFPNQYKQDSNTDRLDVKTF